MKSEKDGIGLALQRMRREAEAYHDKVAAENPPEPEPQHVNITIDPITRRVRDLTPYERYLAAWADYLRLIDKPAFAERIERHGGPFFREHRVLRWPKVWPEVSVMFRDRDSFTDAIEHAMRGEP